MAKSSRQSHREITEGFDFSVKLQTRMLHVFFEKFNQFNFFSRTEPPVYGCSNVAKLQKKKIFLRKKCV